MSQEHLHEPSEEPSPECARCRAYALLARSLEAQLEHHTAQLALYREAISTLDSERKANAILTAEVALLTQQLDQFMALKEKS